MELETRAEFQARATEELDEVVQEFTRRIERIEAELKELRAVLVSASDDPRAQEPASLPTS